MSIRADAYEISCSMWNALPLHMQTHCTITYRWEQLRESVLVCECASTAVASYVSTKLSGARCVNLYLLPCNLLVGFFLSFFISLIKCENEEERYCMICKKSMRNNDNKTERHCSMRIE